ncbi:hypothetical protein WJ16_17355 [Burkholderia metallica]|nr:hypothetical protein WJ16_17355 [Burkholderia metallica]
MVFAPSERRRQGRPPPRGRCVKFRRGKQSQDLRHGFIARDVLGVQIELLKHVFERVIATQ